MRGTVRLATLAVPAMSLLIAIAGVVTPLGLYESLDESDNTSATFVYMGDPSSFGAATPPRSNTSFSRECSWGAEPGLSSLPGPCPYTTHPIQLSYDGDDIGVDAPFGYSTSIPQQVRDIYSSGTKGVRTTVSNYFDIEWRQTMAAWKEGYNNGSEFPVGTYRAIQSMILDDSVNIIEGLIADLRTGGIGFRNHTIPAGFAHGTTWSEDLLFIEPETECVDTNLTIDYVVTTPQQYSDSYSDIAKLFLTDRGGFSNFNQTYPEYAHDNASMNPDLQARAYKAAWLNNAWTMAYMNVTNIGDQDTGVKPFQYLNSTLGKQFALARETQVNAMLLSKDFGSYLGYLFNGDSGIYPNPFDVDATTFDDVGRS